MVLRAVEDSTPLISVVLAPVQGPPVTPGHTLYILDKQR